VIPWAEAFTSFEQRIFDVMDLPVAAAVTSISMTSRSTRPRATSLRHLHRLREQEVVRGAAADIQTLVKDALRIGIDHSNAGRARSPADAYRILPAGVKVLYLTDKEKKPSRPHSARCTSYAVSTYGETS